ncbi:adenylate cyclase type 9-like isoform X2 [Babylonia areolata]|uniref:adenylate cyclase type 9-like isoform X2 n=1 Tax=Babylonia areolata TaxID=304850 RepID=UPI003FD38207
MASNGDHVQNSVVRYDGPHSDTVHVEVQSPAKNRAKGERPGPRDQQRRGTLVLFERASAGSWWNPKFDSRVLEKGVQRYYFPYIRRRFQYALLFVLLASIAWAAFFGSMRQTPNWLYFVAGAVALAVLVVLMLLFTLLAVYQRHVQLTSLVLAVVLCGLLLASFLVEKSDISLVGSFAGSLEVLLLFYTFVPMPLYVCAPLGGLYSVLYECLVAYRNDVMNDAVFIGSKVALHLSLHLLGIHIFVLTQVRYRSNFWKVVQCVRARRDLRAEKQNLDNMIHSLMPKSVADQVMTSRTDKGRGGEEGGGGGGGGAGEPPGGDGRKKRSASTRHKGEIIFRSFNMNMMTDVSILFADIVGFTKMSSNKTAEHLVGLLNDLFGRFDALCTEAKCEKISTLGDCYYCVAGCPEPQPDHAECCVKMGLGMIRAIKEFDEDNHESVNMRVGVHTGTVLCGIVGTRRFKFDVWSNDVTLANIMESTGRPGKVHISEASYEQLHDKYLVEPGEDVEDLRSNKKLTERYDPAQSSFTIKHVQEDRTIKTYFITGIKPGAIDADGPAANSLIISLDIPETAEEPEEETSGNGAASVDPAQQENSVNGMSRATLLPGKRSSSCLEGTENDRLDDKDDHLDTSTVPFNEAWNNNNQMLPCDQLDQQMMDHLNKDTDLMQFSYRLPINRLTLFFNSSRLERDYRTHYFDSQEESVVASPRWQSLIEVFLSIVLLILLAVSAYAVFGVSVAFTLLFAVFLLMEVVVLVGILLDIKLGFLKSMWYREDRVSWGSLKKVWSRDEEDEQPRNVTWWKLHNFVGIVMATLPSTMVYANLTCDLVRQDDRQVLSFCFCLFVAMLSFCNFSMSCSMVKSFVACLVGLVLLVLLNIPFCDQVMDPTTATQNTTVAPLVSAMTTAATNSTTPSAPSTCRYLFSGEELRFEMILSVILILLLYCFLNRAFEISNRLSFHGSAQADKDTCSMQESKEQADWLLHNIIPVHVSDVVKSTHKYSKNHKDVGVIFATIINFNEFYDEGFKGGREYLRVLNELVSDYEDLLDRKCFKDVEKIKTISSSFMAASGLNEASRNANKHPNAHLFALMDFAVELQNAVTRFNESILNFNFVLNIGYNFGEVTAGVIGTTKLLYDIWGDTVNIASRMYSTGEPDHIQVPESTLSKLGEMFEFEYRGEIYVKGKGDMKTYLYKCKRPGAEWE